MAEAVTPRVSFALAAEAVHQLNPWHSDHERIKQRALEYGTELHSLARELLAHLGAEWWYAPFGGDQVSIGYPTAWAAAETDDREASWEAYAQRPSRWRLLSRLFDGVSSTDVVAAARAGEWQPEQLVRVPVRLSGSRIFEIRSPIDWHELCTRYPSRVGSRSQSPAGDGSLSPAWQAVAEDWDGVHLSLIGLLCSPFVRTESTEGASMLWSWDSESTLWLRPERLEEMSAREAFTDASIPPLRRQPPTNPFWSTRVEAIHPYDPSTVLLQPGSAARGAAADRSTILAQHGHGPAPRWRQQWRRLRRRLA